MLRTLGFALFLATASASLATTYPGNGGTGFGGPVGGAGGSLTFTDDHTTLFGTINVGNSNTGLFDELVIYIDSQSGGFTTTSTFDDTGDTLRKAISGFDGTNRATVNFAPGFTADYAIAISPIQASFGGLWALSATGAHNFIASVGLTPTGTSTTYSFSIPIADIITGLPTDFDTSFSFATTYLNAHSGGLFRSNEAFGNTITDQTNPLNTGNPGTDTVLAGFSTYTIAAVPETSTWFAMVLAAGGVVIMRRRRVA